MPCWQTNQLVYEKIRVRPDLFEKARKQIEKEVKAFGYCQIESCPDRYAIYTSMGDYILDLRTGQAVYTSGLQFIHHIVKRSYSLAAVQSVANRSQVFRTFKMNKISDRKIVLTRR